MPVTYYFHNNIEELKLKLNSIIDTPNQDNFRTHFRQSILFKDINKVSGTIKHGSFKIWTHEQGRVTGIFYPIVQAQFRPLSQGVEIEMKSKMNIIGKIVFAVVAIMLAYGIVTAIVIQENNMIEFVTRRLLIGTVLFALMISVPSFIYFKTLKTMKLSLIKELGLTQ
jgi:hypothetical protein